MSKQVQIIIEDGQATIEMEGFVGKSCDEVYKALEGMGVVTDDVKKPEYHQQEVQQTNQ